MSTIVTRAGKGSALTHNEVDDNFVNLNTDKLQSGNTAAALTITSATINGGTITGTALNGTLGATTPSTVAATTISASNSSSTVGTLTLLNSAPTFPVIIARTTGGDAFSVTTRATGNGCVIASTDTTLASYSTMDIIGAGIRMLTGSSATERMRIDSAGNVGIGTASPTSKLTIGAGTFTAAGAGTTGMYTDASSGLILLSDGFVVGTRGGADQMSINAAGGLRTLNTIGVGNATPSTSGAGITFPATQSASTNANTLDDYEEGTWTPSVGGTATYTARYGRYTKVGNLVSYFCLLQIASIGTGSTSAISGLPFTAPDRGYGGGMSYWAALSQAVVYLSPVVGGTGIGFEGSTAATANVTDGIAIFANSSYVILGGTYATS
jgi:hypothetical protein